MPPDPLDKESPFKYVAMLSTPNFISMPFQYKNFSEALVEGLPRDGHESGCQPAVANGAYLGPENKLTGHTGQLDLHMFCSVLVILMCLLYNNQIDKWGVG